MSRSLISRIGRHAHHQSLLGDKKLRIVVLGSPRVGKTTFIQQFLRQDHVETYKSTFETTTLQSYEDGGDKFDVEIIEISNDDSVPTLRSSAIQNSDALILMYSIDDNSSFEHLYKLRELILDLKGEESKATVYIVGNKLDIGEKRATPIWQVADAIVTIDWEYNYAELSALKKMQAVSVFRDIIRLAGNTHTSRRGLHRQLEENMSMLSKLKRRITNTLHI